MARFLFCLAAAFLLTACAGGGDHSAKKPDAPAPVGAIPDLTDGKPMRIDGCVHDSNVAFSKLISIPGANPRLLAIWYTLKGGKSGTVYQFGHQVCVFWWGSPATLRFVDRQSEINDGGQHDGTLPVGVNAKDALAVARGLFPSAYRAEWAVSDPSQL